jgi:GTP-binding protein HflX
MEKELRDLYSKKDLLRDHRRERGFPIVALAGYTQSGKTTFFNRMSAEHKDTGLGPFTTLSTFARIIDHQNNGGDNFSFILIDSIGFIEDMHPTILKAFNTTLGEITNADLILLFVDVSEDLESVFRKLSASKEILKKIATKVPLVICANKTDLCKDDQLEEGKKLISRTFDGVPLVELSALKGNNTEEVVKQAYNHLNGSATFAPSGSLELHSSP